jgi:hypothetical protein
MTVGAQVNFHRGESERRSNYVDAIELYKTSLGLHIQAFVRYQVMPNANLEKNYYLCRNTAFRIAELSRPLNLDKQILDYFRSLARQYPEFKFDPLVDALVMLCNGFAQSYDVVTLERRLGLVKGFRQTIQQGALMAVSSEAIKARFLQEIDRALEHIQQRLKLKHD